MSWQKVKLGQILAESKIQSEKPDLNRRITVRLKVQGVEKRGIENEVAGATKQYIRKEGQFIYGKQNFHKGAFGIVPKELDGFESSSDLPAFDIEKSCLPEYLFYYFKSGNYYLELAKIAYGVATQRINTKEFFELEILLPKIEIQKEVINSLKHLEKSGNLISSELTHQLTLIKQLRQAFLREAMQGHLVKTETNGETGAELLEKIKSEKAQLIKEKKLKKEKEFPPISEDEIPFEIPENWVWCRLGEILKEIKYGTSQSCDYDNTKNSAVLRIPNVSNGEINIEDLKYTNLSEKEISELSLIENDILIVRSNGSRELVGKTALIKKEFIGFCYAGYLIRLRYNSELINANYLWLVSKSPFFRDMIENPLRTTVGINNINAVEISLLKIPLPPLQEQQIIVAKLNELMAFCDAIEASIKESQGLNEILLQEVLRETLQGVEVKMKNEKC